MVTIELYLNTITYINPIFYHQSLIRLANHSFFAFALAWVLVEISFLP